MSFNGQGAASGAASGAAAGTAIMPGWGTAIGAIGGGLLGGFGGGGSKGPSAADLQHQQDLANHPNQNNPFGYSNWTQGPDGSWNQTSGFSGQFGDAANALQGQWAENAQNGYGNGWDAFDKAANASWAQSRFMLDPLQAQAENKNRSMLLNTGNDMGGEIFDTQMSNLGRDQYMQNQNAANNAISAGFQAQGQMFNQNRQAWLDPLNALGQMQGMTPTGQGTPGSNLGYGQLGQQQAQYNNAQNADMINGIGDLGAGLFSFLGKQKQSGAGSSYDENLGGYNF